jgi:hypothetical protein
MNDNRTEVMKLTEARNILLQDVMSNIQDEKIRNYVIRQMKLIFQMNSQQTIANAQFIKKQDTLDLK